MSSKVGDFSKTTYNVTSTNNFYSKEKTVRSSHRSVEDTLKITLIAFAAILVGSIFLWAFGSSFEIAAMEIIGKVFFSLSVTALAIALTILGVAVCCN